MSKIELKNIDKFYDGNHVLKDLNLTVNVYNKETGCLIKYAV